MRARREAASLEKPARLLEVAWRGMLRVHATVFRELDRQLTAEHGFGIDAYGVLITLVEKAMPGAVSSPSWPL